MSITRVKKAIADVSEPARSEQGRQWSRHAAAYDDLFLDPFRPGVENPLLAAIDAIPNPGTKVVADLGCGTGPLLPYLIGKFATIYALDFAPAMLTRAKERLGPVDAGKVTFLQRQMLELETFEAKLDLAIAVNSLVMPDVRDIDKTLRAICASLKPGGVFMGILPSIDAIHYHTMVLMDKALDRGLSVEEAERHAAFHAEHHYYEFGFGRFAFKGLKQKFWQPFEAEFRLKKAGFTTVKLDRVLYPWDESLAGSDELADCPQSWDWFFEATV